MQTRQTAVIIGVGVFVVVGNIIGQYTVLRHFEAKRLAGGDAKPSDVSPPPSLFDLPAPRNLGDLSLTTFPEDVPARSAALANSADESDPAIDPDRHIQNIGGDSPFTLSPELPASPARLTATEDARPIARGIANSVIRAIVEQELPNATDEERDIWAEELQGMPAAAMRNLLRLRRDSGTQLSFNTDVLSKNSRLKQSQHADRPETRTPSGNAVAESHKADITHHQITLTISVGTADSTLLQAIARAIAILSSSNRENGDETSDP